MFMQENHYRMMHIIKEWGFLQIVHSFYVASSSLHVCNAQQSGTQS